MRYRIKIDPYWDEGQKGYRRAKKGKCQYCKRACLNHWYKKKWWKRNGRKKQIRIDKKYDMEAD